MRSVDTNVLARAITRDDVRQTEIADRILRDGAFIALTVLLETGWLLKARYGMSRQQVVATLRSLLDMPGVVVEAADQVEWALGRLTITGDLSDLLHLVACRGASPFATFDRGISPAAGDDPPVVIETLG